MEMKRTRTFEDHHYLTRDPHRFLEGMLIAAWVVEATDVYIYMRDEYPDVIKFLKRNKNIRENNLNIKTRIHLRRGAGAYICGEESSMLESLEGKEDSQDTSLLFHLRLVSSVGLLSFTI